MSSRCISLLFARSLLLGSLSLSRVASLTHNMSAFWQLMRLAHVGSVLVRTASRATSASPLSLCRALTTTTTTSSTSSPSASSASDSTSVATPKKRKYKVVKRPRTSDPDAPMRLDKLLSNLGYCSRRLAAVPHARSLDNARRESNRTHS